MKHLKDYIILSFVLLISILLFSIPVVAFADSEATGAAAVASYDGYTYTGRSSVSVLHSSVKSTCTITASSARPSGYLGANVKCVGSDGRILSQNTQYSSGLTSSFHVNATGKGSVGTSYHTRSVVYIYSPSSGNYHSFRPNNSPEQTVTNTGLRFSPQSVPPVEEGITGSGLTYGSIDNCSQNGPIQYDLVAVVGISGEFGYVYSSDLEPPIPSSPQEANEVYGSVHVELIPVYDLEGNEIDMFAVQYGGIS